MGKVIGPIIGVGSAISLIAVGVLFFGAWIGMLVFGAFSHNTDIISHAPGYWETFFGLWSLGILGGAWNGTKFAASGAKDS
jgi:hypothetical protein